MNFSNYFIGTDRAEKTKQKSIKLYRKTNKFCKCVINNVIKQTVNYLRTPYHCYTDRLAKDN